VWGRALRELAAEAPSEAEGEVEGSKPSEACSYQLPAVSQILKIRESIGIMKN
jgi:hypothetical protein